MSWGMFRQEQNLESRAKNARWIRTLTSILSLTGRGEERGAELCSISMKAFYDLLRRAGSIEQSL